MTEAGKFYVVKAEEAVRAAKDVCLLWGIEKETDEEGFWTGHYTIVEAIPPMRGVAWGIEKWEDAVVLAGAGALAASLVWVAKKVVEFYESREPEFCPFCGQQNHDDDCLFTEAMTILEAWKGEER